MTVMETKKGIKHKFNIFKIKAHKLLQSIN